MEKERNCVNISQQISQAAAACWQALPFHHLHFSIPISELELCFCLCAGLIEGILAAARTWDGLVALCKDYEKVNILIHVPNDTSFLKGFPDQLMSALICAKNFFILGMKVHVSF